MVKVYQIEGELNPPDVLTKCKPKHDFKRHMAFIMGYPELALQLWRQCAKYKEYKHKKIVPVTEIRNILNEENFPKLKSILKVKASNEREAPIPSRTGTLPVFGRGGPRGVILS